VGVESITTPEGRFTADVAGPAGAPLVVLLHGFPQSRHSWRHQVPALGAAGYRAIAPDQRGYSPGVRPDPTTLTSYRIDRLAADVLDLADTQGAATFHLVGHDWGGQIAWFVASQHSQRVTSLTVLSRPHPAAFRRAFKDNADNQQHRSRHHKAFHDPNTAAMLLADDARRLRTTLAQAAVPEASIAEYLSVLGNPAALEAALAWYRAAGALANLEVGPVTMPTLYVWGDSDASVGRAAAEGTAEHVRGRYTFRVLPERGHFLTDEAPEVVTQALLEHVRAAQS
jgi:pimeloyl-ACP methyl ester carboxylesterase